MMGVLVVERLELGTFLAILTLSIDHVFAVVENASRGANISTIELKPGSCSDVIGLHSSVESD
jgi:hypothetical protein